MTGTFFLGLGGQKCGSSWMQAYLARQPGSDFGRLGEYQIWEADLGSVFARYKVAEPGMLQKLRAEAKRRIGQPLPADYLRWQMQTDRDRYFAYFAGLLAKPGTRRTGDVTPSYAALPAPILKGIRDGFDARGIATKALFAMRDPVARLRSHYRMEVAKGRLPDEAESVGLRGFYSGAEAAARMRYDLTLEAIETVFAPEDRFICLFEDMITPAGVARFARFAEVPVEPDAGARPVNARGTASKPLPDETSREIARHYAPVYEAVARRLPEIETLWPSARFALTSA
ncbi:sulfotransferase family protein [Cognatishimia sp. F0-27]|uniref:sulfotransferase family protein n=1 Tax=Cognatishimia sp. F0-27 TaxID=2816855 RepID=UPI001D0C9867|nr:sulfotransferase family protein [Cognatishimia sp. F0-27]MCC1493611.1 sulfotransferase family protein [Cognatishimia sp. F0-27]